MNLSHATEPELQDYISQCQQALRQCATELRQQEKDQVLRNVILCGISCGLESPQEWIHNYAGHLTNLLPYDKISTVEQIVEQYVIPTLYETCMLDSDITTDKLKDWMDIYK